MTWWGFRRDLNILEWESLLNYRLKLGPRAEFNLSEQFRSTLQQTRNEDLWKDNHNLAMNLKRSLTPSLTFETDFTSHVQVDPLSGFDNDLSRNTGTAAFTYRPSANFSLGPTVSTEWQTQLGQRDHGLGYGLKADVTELDLLGYQNNLAVDGSRHIFDRRENHDFSLRYRMQRQFYESTADTLIVVIDRLRQDSFESTPSDPTEIFVRNLTLTSRRVENRLSYRLGGQSTLFAGTSLSSSHFRVNSLRDTLQNEKAGFDAVQSLRIRTRKQRWGGEFFWTYRFRSLDENETTPGPFDRFPSVGFDTEEVWVNLGLNQGYRLAATDSLALHTSVSKFQYDTSDTTNTNQHDQLQWQLTFSHVHRFAQNLRMKWTASAFLKHFVFLSGQFSGGNNWQRDFQLTPTIEYSPGSRFSFVQQFTVRAKYQTFDFDDPETSTRNSVNRQYIVRNKTSYQFSRVSAIDARFDIEFAERGKFFYDAWRQRLALSWRNTEMQLILRRSLGSDWQVSPGASFFRQTRWEHRLSPSGERNRNLKARHTSFGPILEIRYRPTSAVQVVFYGNIQKSNSFRRDSETINAFDLNLNWIF